MEKRTKTGLAVTPSHLKLCDDNLKRAGASSRNEYVEKAIAFYTGYLAAEENPAFFDEIFTSSAKKKMEQVGRSLGTGQYKMAVEVAKLCHILASCLDVPPRDLDRLHEKCVEEVKNIGSVPDFKDVLLFQQGEQWKG